LGGRDGKIAPAEIERAVRRRTDLHYLKPAVLSLTQATELGTVYSPEELRERIAVARRFGLRVHMDDAGRGCAFDGAGAA
jgi:threonine aldolase